MPTVAETQAYFDANAGRLERDRLVGKWSAIETLLDGLPAGARVLECGAGTGLYTLPMLESGLDVTSVDLSRRSLDYVDDVISREGLASRHTSISGEFTSCATEMDADQYDAVVFFKVLHHFESHTSIAAAFDEAVRVLKPGGRVVVYEPNGDCMLWTPLLLSRGRAHYRSERNVRLVRRSFFEGYFMAKAGMRPPEFAYSHVIPGGVVSKAPALGRVDAWLCENETIGRRAVNIAFVALKRED
ncbi:MAG: class I SAM-dependent methyltransferase [Actinomycetia bacterium]|nr:class I SAM-dependent methyltransferase [Actinomycetes bacterium]